MLTVIEPLPAVKVLLLLPPPVEVRERFEMVKSAELESARLLPSITREEITGLPFKLRVFPLSIVKTSLKVIESFVVEMRLVDELISTSPV